MSTLGIENIEHTNGTRAMTVDASGRIFQPAKPIMSVRGRNTNTGNSAVYANFQEVTSWSVTDVNIGGGLSNGRFVAPVTGNYSLEVWSQRGDTTNYRNVTLAVYDGSSYTLLINVYAGNDYKGYTSGGSLIYPLTVGHEVLVGWDNQYSSWHADHDKSSFTCYLIG
mgnify:CR=1 FL=1